MLCFTCSSPLTVKFMDSLRPSLHQYVFIKNDIVSMTTQQLYCIYTSFFCVVFILFSLETVCKSYCFQSFPCRYKVKTQRKVCGFDKNVMKTRPKVCFLSDWCSIISIEISIAIIFSSGAQVLLEVISVSVINLISQYTC